MKILVTCFAFLKDNVFKTKKTWQVESGFVLIVLLLLRFFSGGFDLELVEWYMTNNPSFQSFLGNYPLRVWLADWIMLVGVYYTFHYISVARRMEEAEHRRATSGEHTYVACYHKITSYFYRKECLFFLGFLILEAWSALLGALLFISYPHWRNAWIKYYT